MSAARPLHEAGVKVRRLRSRDRELALARLRRHATRNLLLIDAVASTGLLPGETRSEVWLAARDREIIAIGSVQPLIAIEADLAPEARALLLPALTSAASGLIKTEEDFASEVWERLTGAGRRSSLDRREIRFVLGSRARPAARPLPAGVRVRPARPEDLPALVEAARESLREEDRPDPFDGDPSGFRRWVASRVRRATVVEVAGEIRMVGYADVQRAEGWLLQGVYTWPRWRRQGLAAAGVAALSERAFEAGGDHVQLAVVEGNEPAEELYRSLGFTPQGRLRTVLFH